MSAHEIDFYKSLAVFTSPRANVVKVGRQSVSIPDSQNAPSGSALALLVWSIAKVMGVSVRQLSKAYRPSCAPGARTSLSFAAYLFVISEDDFEPIHTALAGTQSISIVLFQVQAHIQEKVIQLYRDAKKLSFVCLFHECFVNAVCLDLITGLYSASKAPRASPLCIQVSRIFLRTNWPNKESYQEYIFCSFALLLYDQ